MAEVAPLRAVRYNGDKISSLNKVVIPPYDVITPEEQEAFYQAEPHNFIRLELNKVQETDTAQDNSYTRAARHFQGWLAEGALIRDERPAFYVNETTYSDANGQIKTRKGFLTLLKVEDFTSGVVLPHEKTFTGHKEDRLNLTKAVGANLSPIFAIYPDEDNQVPRLLESARRPELLADFQDQTGPIQRLYAVDDPTACEAVQRLMLDKTIFIADGHHRYETAINYRNYMRELYPERGENAAFNYVMVYLCSMSDPGLTVFPYHRILPVLSGFAIRDFLALANRCFNFQEILFAGDPVGARVKLARSLAAAGEKRPSFGLASSESESYFLLSLKRGMCRTGLLQNVEPTAVRDLDVVVLSDLVLEPILGLDNITTDQLHTIKYISNMQEALDEVATGKAQAAFLMNPTRVSQVEAVAKQGLVMPRKSTYFYPKVLAGLTVNLIVPEEDAQACRG
jgi:uncharacterized protein (DUF1015 family)